MPTSDLPGKLPLAGACPDQKIAYSLSYGINIHKHLHIIENKVEMGRAT